jgi:mycothiol synthase
MTIHQRPLEESDAAALSALMAIVAKADGDSDPADEASVRESFGDPYREYERGSVGLFLDGALVGYGLLTTRAAAEPRHKMRYSGSIHPSFRGKGLGDALLEWAESAARPLHDERFPGKPLDLGSGCVSGNAAAVALHVAHGFRSARVFQRMIRDLSELPAFTPLPDGVRAETFSMRSSEDARLIRNDAFKDHWGSVPVSPAQWAHMRASGSFRAAYSFVAYEGDEPLGILLSHDHGDDLYVAVVGTRARGRKRGIASALLSLALSQAWADGFATASLSVDADSRTGAVAVYERAGFRQRVSHTVYEKSLSG